MSHQKTEEQMGVILRGTTVLGRYLHKQVDNCRELRSGGQLENCAEDLASKLSSRSTVKQCDSV